MQHNGLGLSKVWDFRPVSLSTVNKNLKIEQRLQNTKNPNFV
jgi:hypothetical protein